MNFQQVIMCLNEFWAGQGCVIWQPHNVQVGAGTSNPATVLRVLGPEPWNVGYPEPSARPADGRYGENPNRWYEYYQYQVILKPDPGNHIDLYLESLEAIGIDWRKHDIRFVEDNWKSPSLGAWGLGWEVWLDGLEITQYTYFQQACGIDLDPVCVEITYGVERIAMFLQAVRSIPDIQWLGDISYGDLHLPEEIDYCEYNFDYADVGRLQQMYNLFEEEAKTAIAHELVLPAHDYLLKCSHVFNVMDARGAVGVTQRTHYFARMRELARQVAAAYLEQRESLGFPLTERDAARIKRVFPVRRHEVATKADKTADFLLEIGTEELPAQDLSLALEQLQELVPKHFSEARLSYRGFRLAGTPRRLAIYAEHLAPYQSDEERLIQGPPANIAFDTQNKPTKAAEGFAKSVALPVDQLQLRDFQDKKYLTAITMEKGQPTLKVLKEIMPKIITELKFPLSMRWNETQATFSRPIRWLVALFGDALVDVKYAGVPSDRITYGSRPSGSPELPIAKAEDYFRIMQVNGIVVDMEKRRAMAKRQIDALAAEVGGQVLDDPNFLDEVTNLVEQPVVIRGSFDPTFLALPPEVLITVMKKHQRYFPIVRNGKLLPYFIVVANGGTENRDAIRAGNEEVLRARFADAKFFYEVDTRKPLSAYVSELDGLIFQEQLGSYLDKTERLKKLVPRLTERLNLPVEGRTLAYQATELAKADLVTDMVIEFTSLQGIMGRYYAQKSGEDPRVGIAIQEHYLPRFTGDELPTSWPGIVVGLADRLDSLVGLFAVGLTPTGTADPYGLRRAALAIIQVLIGKSVSLSLQSAVLEVAPLLPMVVSEETLSEVVTFIQRRLQGWLLDQGFRHDLVEAVLAERGDDPALAYTTVRALTEWDQRPEFDQLLTAYARSVRIVWEFKQPFPLIPEHLTEPASRRLYDAYLVARKQVNSKTNVDELFTAMLPLVEPVNTFFNDILVMHEDKSLRNARLGLLQRIAELPKGVVDLTRVVEF